MEQSPTYVLANQAAKAVADEDNGALEIPLASFEFR
jgi:hypothetical protein